MKIMTKKSVEKILKRYPEIKRAIEEDKTEAMFYVGKRKQVIKITDERKAVFRIIEEVSAREQNVHVRHLIEGLKSGRQDIAIMQEVPWQKNAYYERKKTDR